MEKTGGLTCGIAGMGFYLPEKEVSVRELAEQAGNLFLCAFQWKIRLLGQAAGLYMGGLFHPEPFVVCSRRKRFL